MQQTGAMRAAYLKPSWCCSSVSAFSVYTAQQTDSALLPYFPLCPPGLGVTGPPQRHPRCPALPLRRSPPTAAPQPLCRAGGSRAATHPARGSEKSAGRSSAPRQVCGAAVRRVRGGRGRAASEASRARPVAVRTAAALGEVSAGGARLACSGARCRAAAAARGGAHSGLQAECARIPEPRAVAPPRTPPSASGARRKRKRGARTPPRDPGRSARAPTRTPARPRTARSLPGSSRHAGAGRPGRACGRVASWAGPAGRAAGGAERGAGYLQDEVHPGAAQVLKRGSVVSSAPPPIFCSLPPPFLKTNNPDRLKDRKGEVGGKTNPISSDQTVWGWPMWVSFHLVCVCWGGKVVN